MKIGFGKNTIVFGRFRSALSRHSDSFCRHIVWLLIVFGGFISAHAQYMPEHPAYNVSRLYVSPEGNGRRNGSSWANAADGRRLQNLLDFVTDEAGFNNSFEIWIAGGTYVPSTPRVATDAATASFVLNGVQVSIHGGFRGFDAASGYRGETSLDDRELETSDYGFTSYKYATLFSGDVLGNDDLGEDVNNSSMSPTINESRADNVYNVLVFSPTCQYVTVQGITIANGSAIGLGAYSQGGGVTIDGVRSGIRDCVLFNNYAMNEGGGAYLKSATSFIAASLIINNAVPVSNTTASGGAVYMSSGIVYNSLVVNNNRGIRVAAGSMIVNSTIANNLDYNLMHDNTARNIYLYNSVLWSDKLQSSTAIVGYESFRSNIRSCAIAEWAGGGTQNISLSAVNDGLDNSPAFARPSLYVGTRFVTSNSQNAFSFNITQLSPMVNAGESQYLISLTTSYGYDTSYDLLRNVRFNRELDMGAYELASVSSDKILYVKNLSDDELAQIGENEVRDGSSWRLAVSDVQWAIDQIYNNYGSGEVWVAGGTYYPSSVITDESGVAGLTDRHRSFIMRSGVDVYGGFRGTPGDEGIEDEITRPHDARYPQNYWAFEHVTVFSGDMDKNDAAKRAFTWDASKNSWEQNYGNNSYHVVWFGEKGFYPRTNTAEPPVLRPLDAYTILDGVTIVGGCADAGERGSSSRAGGGVYLTDNGEIRNCIVAENFAQTYGGGIFINNGGRVSQCLIVRNASPGIQVLNGRGGGVYIYGQGSVIKSQMINNSARVGGGVACGAITENAPILTDRASGYYGMIADCVVSNNTAVSDAGGVHFLNLGSLTNTTVVKNYCVSRSSNEAGNSGGMVADGYGIVFNTAFWGNATADHIHQFFAQNAQEATSEYPATVQVSHSALQDLSNTVWGVNTSTTSLYPLNDNNGSPTGETGTDYPYFELIENATFDPISSPAGVYVTESDRTGTTTLEEVIAFADNFRSWKPGIRSTFRAKGGSSSNAPYVRLVPSEAIYVYPTGLQGRTKRTPFTIGAYYVDPNPLQYALKDNKLVVFIDYESGSFSNDGSSWDNAIRSVNRALDYLASVTDYPGYPREIWIKSGTSTVLEFNNHADASMATVLMRAGIGIYGGFHPDLTGTDGATDRYETFIPAGSETEVPKRDPVNYRTVWDGRIDGTADGRRTNHLVTYRESGTAILDGLHLVNADCSTGSSFVPYGAAILMRSGEMIVRNCMLENNTAFIAPAIAMLNDARRLVMVNTVVNNNTSVVSSDNPLSSAVLTQGIFEANYCDFIHNRGAGLYVSAGSADIFNSIFWGNSSTPDSPRGTDLQLNGSEDAVIRVEASGIQYAPEAWNLFASGLNNIRLGLTETDGFPVPTFVNASSAIGTVLFGYDTPGGGPAVFEPLCLSPLIGMAKTVPDEYPDLMTNADIYGVERGSGGLPDIGAYEATCLNPNGTVIYVKYAPGNTSRTAFGTGDGSSWQNAINGNADYGTDDGLPYDEIEYTTASDGRITGLQYAVNQAYIASLRKNGTGAISYTTVGGSGEWSNGSGGITRQIPTVDTTRCVEVWVAEGEYTNSRGFFMRDAVNVLGGFPSTGTPDKSMRNPREYITVIQTMTTAEAEELGKDYTKFADPCGFGYDNSYELNVNYANANRTHRVLTQPLPYYAWHSNLGTTEKDNIPLNPFVRETVWDGFVIQNGRTRIYHGKDGGAGVALRKNGRIENCIIRNNINFSPSNGSNNTHQSRGAGMFLNDGVVSNCSFFNNRFLDTGGEQYGGAVYLRYGTVYNCVFAGNYCGGTRSPNGSAIYLEKGSFFNNTVVDNRSDNSDVSAIYCGFYFADGSIDMYNSIVYGNDNTYQIMLHSNVVGNFYNCALPSSASISGKTNLSGMIYQDPGFVMDTNDDAEQNDYRLNGTSPCINAGHNRPSGIVLPETDMDYTARIKDCSIDIGAYEIDQSEPIVPAMKTIDGEQVAVIYVRSDVLSGKVDGSSWEDAACEDKLQKALNWAGYVWKNRATYRNGNYAGIARIQLYIGKGTYYPTDALVATQPRTRSFMIPAGVEVYGGFDPEVADETIATRDLEKNRTIFSGAVGASSEEDLYRVVTFGMKQHDADDLPPVTGAEYFADRTPDRAILNGIYITRGNANHPNDESLQNGGGARVTFNGVIQQCRIYDCQALHRGGAVYLEGDADRMTGGFLNTSLLWNNSAGEGGAVYADDNTTVWGCTIVRNSTHSNGLGGGMAFGNRVMVMNTVLWGNESGQGKNISGNQSQRFSVKFGNEERQSWVFNYCAVEGMKPVGLSNISLSSTNSALTVIFGTNYPVFTAPDQVDYSISRLSSLAYSGSLLLSESDAEIQSLYIPKYDLIGSARFGMPNRKAFDIGALICIDRQDLDPSGETVAQKGGDGVYRLFVSQSAKGLATGHSWRNAMSSIQDALDYFADDAHFESDPKRDTRHCEIWVSKGEYASSVVEEGGMAGAFKLNPYTSVYGGFEGSSVPYYESWIEPFVSDPIPTLATVTSMEWRSADRTLTAVADGASVSFDRPAVTLDTDQPATCFLHVKTTAKDLSVRVNDILFSPSAQEQSGAWNVFTYELPGGIENKTLIKTIVVSDLKAGDVIDEVSIDNRPVMSAVATSVTGHPAVQEPTGATVAASTSNSQTTTTTPGAGATAAGQYAVFGASSYRYWFTTYYCDEMKADNGGYSWTLTREDGTNSPTYRSAGMSIAFSSPVARSSARYMRFTLSFGSVSAAGNREMHLWLYNAASATGDGTGSFTYTFDGTPSGSYEFFCDLETGRYTVNGVEHSGGIVWTSGGNIAKLALSPIYDSSARYTATLSNVSFVNNLDKSAWGTTDYDTETFVMTDEMYDGEDLLSDRKRYDWNGNGLLEEYEFLNETILSADLGEGFGDSHVMGLSRPATGDYSALERVELDGLTLTRGNAAFDAHGGGGLYSEMPVTVRNCQFLINRTPYYGGAISANDIEVYASLFGGNSVSGLQDDAGGRGGAIYIHDGGRAVIVNSVIYNNSARIGSAYYGGVGSKVDFVNNTIVRNAWSDDPQGVVDQGTTLYAESPEAGNRLWNTVVWGNDDLMPLNKGHWSVVTSASDADPSIADDFQIFLDRVNTAVTGPRFGLPSDQSGAAHYFVSVNYSLPSLSVLVNAGTNGGSRKLDTDADGNIVAGEVILEGNEGYYRTQHEYGRTNVPDTLNGKWRINREPDTYKYVWIDGVEMIDVATWKEGTIDIGAYEYESVALTPFGGNIIYVKAEEEVSDKTNNGETWQRATSDLQQAIKVLLLSPSKKDKFVKIAEGTYVPFLENDYNDRSFTISKPDVQAATGGMEEYSTRSLTIRGGFPASINDTDKAVEEYRDPNLYRTILQGSASTYHVIYVAEDMDRAGENGTPAPVAIEGVTIFNGNADGEKEQDRTGAAIYADNSDLLVRNCVLTDNTATGEHGAAVRVRKGRLYNNVIHSNRAFGIEFAENGEAINNTVALNTKGGIYGQGMPGDPLLIYNNLVWHNYPTGIEPADDNWLAQVDVRQAQMYSNAVQVASDLVSEEYAYDNAADRQVELGDTERTRNKTLGADNQDIVSGPRFISIGDDVAPLDKNFSIGPGRKLINTGYRYMTDGGVYDRDVNVAWYRDRFSVFYYGSSTDEELATDPDADRYIRFVDAGGNNRLAGHSIDIGAYEYQRLFYPNLYVRPNGTGLGQNWNDAMGSLQEAILSAYYSGDPDESGTYGTVWVAGGTYDLDETLQWMPNVKVYGGFYGTNETRLTQRPGLLEKGSPRSTITVRQEGVPVVVGQFDEEGGITAENWNEMNGFTITGSKNAPAMVVPDKFSVVNCVITGNSNPTGTIVDNGGLLYNVLLYGNESGTATVTQSETAIALQVTAAGSGEQIAGGNTLNTINGETTVVAGKPFVPTYVKDYLGDTEWSYQLSDRKDEELFNLGERQEYRTETDEAGVESLRSYIADYRIPQRRDDSEYVDIVNLYDDTDLLGNRRMLPIKQSAATAELRTDYGCFETWNLVEGDRIVVLSDTLSPKGGSVVYAGRNSTVYLSPDMTDEFAPAYLLLRGGAGLHGGGNTFSLTALAVERDLPARTGDTVRWDMIALPFDVSLMNNSLRNGVTVDGAGVSAGVDVNGQSAPGFYLYDYDGLERANSINRYYATNSRFWKSAGQSMLSGRGYLIASPDTMKTVRFTVSSATPVYTETGEDKRVALAQYNRIDSEGGVPKYTYKENMGWNLFGVPYLCSYDLSMMDLPHILYPYDSETGAYRTVYSWESATGVKPFTAFFTQTATLQNSETLLFPQPQSLDVNGTTVSGRVMLRVRNGEGRDEVMIAPSENPSAPLRYEMGRDGIKFMALNRDLPQIYVENADRVRLSATLSAQSSARTPLGVYAVPGANTIELGDNTLEEELVPVLIDAQTGRRTDLTRTSYSFVVDEAGEISGRFYLTFLPGTGDSSVPEIYASKRKLHVLGAEAGDCIQVYDTSGRMLRMETLDTWGRDIDMPGGHYLVRMQNRDGEERCVKKVSVGF